MSPEILDDPNTWWFNGHLLCNTRAPWNPRISKQLIEYISKLQFPIKTCTFYLNPRDFPWLRKDRSFPYPFLSKALPYNVNFLPLSFYGGNDWDDLLVSPPEHWNVWEESLPLRQIPFRNKGAVFRGTLTGRYMDNRNIRIRVCECPVVDGGLTQWTKRERVKEIRDSELLLDFPPPIRQELIRPEMPKWQQCENSVLVYVPGHVASSRLGWQLCSGSCVLSVVDPSCAAPDMWFHEYIPHIAKYDNGFQVTDKTVYFECEIEDLSSAIQWIHSNEKIMYAVIKQCLEWASQYFSPEFQKRVWIAKFYIAHKQK